jgi:hypothetical protein
MNQDVVKMFQGSTGSRGERQVRNFAFASERLCPDSLSLCPAADVGANTQPFRPQGAADSN